MISSHAALTVRAMDHKHVSEEEETKHVPKETEGVPLILSLSAIGKVGALFCAGAIIALRDLGYLHDVGIVTASGAGHWTMVELMKLVRDAEITDRYDTVAERSWKGSVCGDSTLLSDEFFPAVLRLCTQVNQDWEAVKRTVLCRRPEPQHCLYDYCTSGVWYLFSADSLCVSTTHFKGELSSTGQRLLPADTDIRVDDLAQACARSGSVTVGKEKLKLHSSLRNDPFGMDASKTFFLRLTADRQRHTSKCVIVIDAVSGNTVFDQAAHGVHKRVSLQLCAPEDAGHETPRELHRICMWDESVAPTGHAELYDLFRHHDHEHVNVTVPPVVGLYAACWGFALTHRLLRRPEVAVPHGLLVRELPDAYGIQDVFSE